MQTGQQISLRSVHKAWDGVPAVKSVNIDVPAGTFTVLLGPSGCGKSTTLRIISGLEAADSGEVFIGERDVSQLPPASRDIAMVFQSYALFPHLSVAENILFGLKVRRTRKAEQHQRLAQTADMLGLTDYLSRKPSQLSGGQQQRVALGRAVIAERSVCLMDEPLSNLDAKLRNTMRTEIRELQQKLGFTMVYVTHDQSEAITMADQVVLMRNGQVEHAGTPRQIYEQPATLFAASFIGTPPMNLFPLNDLLSHLSQMPGESIASSLNESHDDNVVIGIRPEHIQLASSAVNKGGAHPVSLLVSSVEYLGADTLANCTLGNASLLVRLSGNAQPVPGDLIPVTWSIANMHYFNATDDARIELTDASFAIRLLQSLLTQTHHKTGHDVDRAQYDDNNNLFQTRFLCTVQLKLNNGKPFFKEEVMRVTSVITKTLVAGAMFLGTTGATLAVDLEFYFPVAVGGKAADTIQALTDEYVAANSDVNIKAVYAGSYKETVTKALTAARGGKPPQLSVILSVDMFTLIDEDVIIPFDDLAKTDDDKAWMSSFYPAFMLNSQTGGKTYGIPFQRSTPVLYWNKEAFKEAGLDPETPPATWEETIEFGKKLVKKDDNGNVTRWGVRIPSSGFPYWLFQGLTTQNDVILANSDGNQTNFDDPKVVEALQYLVDLNTKHGVMAPGIIEWGATPKAFFEGQTAMMWTSTGNLTNVRANAPFDFGVGLLPGNKRRGAPTGGGNFFIFKEASDEQKAAAFDFVKWITQPNQSAKWTIATGYVAPRPDTWETDTMKAYTSDFPPALVARDQLEFAVAELSTYENQRITAIFNDALAAAITGDKSPADALAEAQKKAEAILTDYR